MRRLLSFLCLPLLLTGCSITPTAPPSAATGRPITGHVHGGQQPIVGAHVYLFAANTTGYGGKGIAPSASNASISLLNPVITGHSDATGGYVLTAADGSFSLTGDYTCISGQQVYLLVLGGDPGAGANSASGLMAIAGTCPAAGFFLPTLTVWVNEASTIAAAYAMAGFASDATHVSSSGTALAKTGIANAFANAANMVPLSTGSALSTTPAGNGTVPQAEINTLANILAACVNSSGPASAPCGTLLSTATTDGTPSGAAPTDTATAAINIAHNPGANIAALYTLPPPTTAFAPTLPTQPNDFTIALNYTGGSINCPQWLAIDATGNAWVANLCDPTNLSVFSPLGAVLSGPSGYSGGGMVGGSSVALDLNGNAWVTDSGWDKISEFTSTGTPITGGFGYSGGGVRYSFRLAVDGANNIWVASQLNPGNVTKFNSSGTAIGNFGSGIQYAMGIAIDGSGNAWVADSSGANAVSKIGPTGAVLAGSPITGGGLNSTYAVAVDKNGNAWVTNRGGSGLSKIAPDGTVLSGSSGFTGGGVGNSSSIAIDGAGNVWVGNGGSISEFDPTGNPLSPASGFNGPGINAPYGLAVDGSGNLWTANFVSESVTQFIGVAAPVITPLVAGLPATPTADGSSNLGTRP